VTFKAAVRRLSPRQVRDHRILRGPLRGRIIVTSLHDYPAAILGTTEKRLLGWLAENVKPGQTWLDVGAHYGYTALAIAERVGAGGKVFAFEPSITTAGHLNRTRLLNHLEQIKVVPIALGEAGSLHRVVVAIERGMANHEIGGSSSDDIYVAGFDDLWPGLDGGRVDGVKVDVQGMEAATLAGMRRCLAEQRPKLALEFHAGVDRAQVLAELARAGYVLPGRPIEPLPGETEAAYHDNRSYAFEAVPA
jgi:FkbM family methyltransferase